MPDSLPFEEEVLPQIRTRRNRHGLHAIDKSAATTEPVRDWSLGFITGHRSLIVVSMVMITSSLYRFQNFMWPQSIVPHSLWDNVIAWGSLFWLGAVIPGFLGMLGMLAYKYPRNLDEVKRIPQLVVFRVVTVGKNANIAIDTINRCVNEMASTPLFDYLVEIVIENTDRLDEFPTGNNIKYIVIPHDYQTPNGSLFKARALEYACLFSKAPADAWLVHLDEETQPTSSGIKGIAKMIGEEEASGRLRVGQGALLYHRDWKTHPILTLADNVRTGDDFARFYFQHKLGRTIFGLHGSYIVVRNDVEQAIGFDFGPQGSITEDAFWALKLMEAGGRARWVDGYLEEQSTQSVHDFVKQRRRWYYGLMKVSIHAPVKLRWRLAIGINTILWTLSPFAALYTFVHFFYGFEVEPWVRLLANLSYASFTTLYLTGLRANMDEHGITNWFSRTGWIIAQLALTPIFSVIESIGVVYAIVSPPKGFDVINK